MYYASPKTYYVNNVTTSTTYLYVLNSTDNSIIPSKANKLKIYIKKLLSQIMLITFVNKKHDDDDDDWVRYNSSLKCIIFFWFQFTL